jgi:hypothetical protein
MSTIPPQMWEKPEAFGDDDVPGQTDDDLAAEERAQERFEELKRERHEHHEGHEDHEHGEGCGHEAVPHEDHVDYVHDGHRHWFHEGHWDEH